MVLRFQNISRNLLNSQGIPVLPIRLSRLKPAIFELHHTKLYQCGMNSSSTMGGLKRNSLPSLAGSLLLKSDYLLDLAGFNTLVIDLSHFVNILL